MERFLMISPAIVAILIFIYMRNVQAKRKEKLRKRLLRREKSSILTANTKKDNTENTTNEN